jgi:hypothetical protein
VYGYDNKQKVKADERKHAEETRVLQEMHQRSEAEFRLQRMRDKAERRQQQQQEGAAAAAAADEHVDLRDGDDAVDEDELNASASLSASAARDSSSTAAAPRPRRFIVQQEDDTDAASTSAAAAAAESCSATAAAAAPFTLFPDAELQSSVQKAEMTRMRAADTRAAELKHMRTHAPVSMFGEAFRDATTGEDQLRPWYSRGEGEQRAAALRAQEAAKKTVVVEPRSDGRRGVQLRLNTSGLPVHRASEDPLQALREQLGQPHQPQQHEPPAADSGASLVQQAIEAAKQQAHTAARVAATAAAAFHPPQPAMPAAAAAPHGVVDAPSMLRRFSAESASSEQMPPLQSVDAVAQADTSAGIGATAIDNPSGGAGVIGGRRSRWDAPVPQAELRFHAQVGFTNADEVLSPTALSTLKPPPPLFAAAAAASAASSSAGQDDHSSSSTDSSEDDSGARRTSTSRHGSDSRSDSRSHHRAHKKSKEKKKSKSSRYRSRSRSRSRDRSHKKHHRSSGSSHKDKSSKRKKRSRSSSREHSRKKAKAIAPPTAAGIAPSAAAAAAVSVGLKSTAELRAEREARERTERARAAALLQVPVWAAAHPHSITQRELSDERPQPPPRFQGRHFSEFAMNPRS